jgi:hypothetical protein
MEESRMSREEAINASAVYTCSDWKNLTTVEKRCRVLLEEINRLNVGIVDALSESPIDREKLIELLLP